MNDDDTFEPEGVRRSKFRLRFSLLALFIVVTLICIFLAWVVQPNYMVATAMFRVSSVQDTILDNESAQWFDEQEFVNFKKSQLALLKSYYVLNAAVRNPGISALSIFQGEIPEDWLENHLEAEYPEDGEYLSISLRGTEAQSGDLVLLVDAVAKAYADEAIYRERARRAGARDQLNRSLEDLTNKIAKKLEDYSVIAADASVVSPGSDSLRQLTLGRLERVDSELMRLEDEQAKQNNSDADNSKVFEKRIAQLRTEQGELEKKLITQNIEPAGLKMIQTEINQLQKVADEMAAKSIRMEIESNAPQRIEQVQKAVVEPAD